MLGTGNEIAQVDGLDGISSLTELVIDRNKIKVHVLALFFKPLFHKPHPFPQTLENSSWLSLRSLRELHIKENRYGQHECSCDSHMI